MLPWLGSYNRNNNRKTIEPSGCGFWTKSETLIHSVFYLFKIRYLRFKVRSNRQVFLSKISYAECLLGPFFLPGVEQCIVSSFPLAFSLPQIKLKLNKIITALFMSPRTSLWTTPALTRPSCPASLLSAVNSQNHSVGNVLSTQKMMTSPACHPWHSESLPKTSLHANNSVTSRTTFYKSKAAFPGCLWFSWEMVQTWKKMGPVMGTVAKRRCFSEPEVASSYSSPLVMPVGMWVWVRGSNIWKRT